MTTIKFNVFDDMLKESLISFFSYFISLMNERIKVIKLIHLFRKLQIFLIATPV